MIHLYYGDGKGKTTAAAGLALRAAGSGRRVIFSQFLKGRRSGEIESFLQIPQVTVLRGDFREKFTFEMNERELKEEAEKSSDLLEEAFAQADSEKADLLVLDEVVSAAERKMISGERLRILIERHRERFEIVLTGRSPSDWMVEAADYVTKMKKIKHKPVSSKTEKKQPRCSLTISKM